MKPGKSSLRRVSLRIGRWISIAVVVALVMAAAAYPIINWSRQPLDDAAREELLRTGKARAFVATSLGIMHVRDSGPSDRPVVLLVHGGVVGGYAFENISMKRSARRWKTRSSTPRAKTANSILKRDRRTNSNG